MPPQTPKDGHDRTIAKLRAELEQARTSLEDAGEQNLGSAEEIRRLQAELREREEGRRAAETAMTQLRGQISTSAASLFALEAEQARGATVEEELSVAAEELQVLVEELGQANAALQHANDHLERRVAERTAALEAANAELRDAEARLSLALRVSGAGIWDWNVAVGGMIWSDETFALFGLLAGEVPPSLETWLACVVEEDRPRAEAWLRERLRSGRPEFALEYRTLHPQKGLRWLATEGRCLFGADGQPLRMIGLTRDVTAHKQAVLALDASNRDLAARVDAAVAEREATQRAVLENQKMEALGRLTGGVAHDFNNLLTVVISGLSLLRDEPPGSPRHDKLVSRMLQASQRGAELTRRLLTFGRGQDLHAESIVPAARLAELRELLGHSLREDIAVVLDCPDGTWPAHADSGALELAMLNLAVNARDAMPHGGTLTLAARNRVVDAAAARELGIASGEYVEWSVADTGTGMPAKVRAHAFEPFFTTKEIGKGTGLGLAQVYGFARQSGGTACMESAEERGTTVFLLLPRAAAGAALPEPAQAAALRSAEPLSVLVVEDNEAVSDSLLDLLGQMGHGVTCAAGVEAAEQVLASRTPVDVVLTDMLLAGGQSGADVVRAVRRHRPGLRVVLTTGFGGAALLDPDLEGIPMLRKPYEPAQLAAVLSRARLRRMA